MKGREAGENEPCSLTVP